MEQELTWLKKSTKIIAKKGIKTLQGKNLPSSREFITVIGSGNAGGDFLPYHFVFPGKKERKLENYNIEIAATQSSQSEVQVYFYVSDLVGQKTDCQSLVHKYI